MQVGDQLGQYNVVEHIGRGGMADVWSARDERLGRTVAVKTIMADVSNEETRSQFEHEARIIAALEHPHILPIYDFGEFQRQLYIVMRYVAGGSLLDSIVDQGAMSDAEVVRIGDAIALALQRAHAEQIVHRDLKPANVLLDRFGTPYLADFGLAAVAGAGDEDNVSSGTLIYMPPEQMFGQPVDQRADIYSFAIVIFQMITGEFPFEGAGVLCLRQAQQGDELPDPRKYRPELPEHVVTVLRIATAMDTEARFDSAAMFMNEIKAGLQGHTAFSTATPAAEVGPAQEPIPYDALTDATIEEDLIVTMRGPVDDDLLQTMNFDSSAVDSGIVPRPAVQKPESAEPPGVDAQTAVGISPALQEAQHLYRRMVRVWARGQGRFLTGATHFANIHAYYSEADANDLEMDIAGQEAMLRGAVEHDYGLDFWLALVPDVDSRRMIFLHALRSDLAAARALAVRLLRDVPDGEMQNVALTVARLLHSETDDDVRREIVALLAHRGERVPGWREVAFARDTDLLLAEQALRTDAPDVAELAARTIGQLHSQAAVVHLVEHAAEAPVQARVALAFIRDEADSLPPVVPIRLRAQVFLRLTGHYLMMGVGRLGLRFFTALLGTALGIGVYVDAVFPSSSILQLAHLYRVIGNAQTFGLVAGLGGMLAAALPLRLAGSRARRQDGTGATLWTWWARLAMGVIVGGAFGMVAYLNFQVIALQFTDPGLAVVSLGGLGLTLGAAVAATFRWPLVLRWLAAASTLFAALDYAYWRNVDGLGDAIIFLRGPEQRTLFLAMAVFAALGIFGPELLDALRGLVRRVRS